MGVLDNLLIKAQAKLMARQKCSLCQDLATEVFFKKKSGELYHRCKNCGFISLDPQFFLKPQEEHERYLTHQNNVEDQGYQNYLKPVVDAILERQSPQDQGLDYGCGPSSVVSHLLKLKHYQIKEYDPYFKPDAKTLTQTYDYVVCTEVIEHFYDPRKELQQLIRFVKPKGHLYIKTSLTDQVKDFEKWHYHRDPTHVSFYSKYSLQLWAETQGLQSLEVTNDRIIFRK